MPENWLHRRVQMSCTLLYSQSSGIIFGISETIPEMVPDNCQAPFLGPSGTSFGIVRHQFWDHQAPVLGCHAYFLEFKTCFTLKTNVFQKKTIAQLNFTHKNTAFRCNLYIRCTIPLSCTLNNICVKLHIIYICHVFFILKTDNKSPNVLFLFL